MISSFVRALISAFKARRKLALGNVALQQLAVLRRSVKRTRLSNVDREFWVLLRRIWTDWESVLVIVKPETVVRWHRCGFRRYWAWKSRRRRPGRPGVTLEIRELIRNMSRANPSGQNTRTPSGSAVCTSTITTRGIIQAMRICCCSQPATSYLSPSARCAPVNGLAGCYVSTIGKPHEYFDLTRWSDTISKGPACSGRASSIRISSPSKF